jgi:AcrR family transcriptional regulator
MPRPRSLDNLAIASAALAVIDRDGLEALSMRTAAAELGMGTMSLYRYVAGRQDIERLAVDLIFSALDPEVTPGAPWQERLSESAWSFRAAVAAHPAAIPLLPIHYRHSPAALRWSEALLGILADAGFSSQQSVVALRSLTAYVIGALLNAFSTSVAETARTVLAEFSPDQYPNVMRVSQHVGTLTPEFEFGAGLAMLVAGLTVTADQGAGGSGA